MGKGLPHDFYLVGIGNFFRRSRFTIFLALRNMAQVSLMFTVCPTTRTLRGCVRHANPGSVAGVTATATATSSGAGEYPACCQSLL
jgi:hypothetical protein